MSARSNRTDYKTYKKNKNGKNSAHSKNSGGRGPQQSKSDESVRRAIERAVGHAQLALSEGVASARALLDAASIGVSGGPAQDHPKLSEFAWALDRLAAALSGEAPSLRAAALSALLAAIDGEVLRWEIRSRTDDDARAVLRAFLGLREVLWEMGVRRSDAEPEPESAQRDAHSRPKRGSAKHSQASPAKKGGPGRARVQRITIRG
jgi:hypothetical protein